MHRISPESVAIIVMTTSLPLGAVLALAGRISDSHWLTLFGTIIVAVGLLPLPIMAVMLLLSRLLRGVGERPRSWKDRDDDGS